MKILHLNDHLSWSGGIETYLLSLVPALEGLGHPQAVGFGQGEQGLVRSSYHLPFLNRADAASRRLGFRETARLLRDERFDVVHVHNVHNTGALEACLEAVPTFLHGHDYRHVCPASTFFFRGPETICQRTCGPGCFAATLRGHCMSLRPPYAWTYYRRVRFVAKHAAQFAGVVANSRHTAARFVEAGFRPERVQVLSCFCPFEPAERPRTLPQQPTMLFIGRTRPIKGWRYFVEALGQLPKEIRGIMVGDMDPASSRAIRDLAAQCGCADRLELRPWVVPTAIREIYGMATVVVFPSIWAEPQGLVGVESLACGVPVVASDVGGVREWLVEGQTGRLVPPKDAPAIAGAVLDIVRSPDQGWRLGENGLRHVQAHFRREDHVQRLLECYRSACARPELLTAV